MSGGNRARGPGDKGNGERGDDDLASRHNPAACREDPGSRTRCEFQGTDMMTRRPKHSGLVFRPAHFLMAAPKQYARRKADLFPDEGGAVIVELGVPDDVIALTDLALYPLRWRGCGIRGWLRRGGVGRRLADDFQTDSGGGFMNTVFSPSEGDPRRLQPAGARFGRHG